jgi:hypothetical protein
MQAPAEFPAAVTAAVTTYWGLIDRQDYSVARLVRTQALNAHGDVAQQAFRSLHMTKGK